MSVRRFALPGSQRTIPPHARLIGSPHAAEHLDVTVLLRRRQPVDLESGSLPLSRSDFLIRHGARTEDVARVEAFAQHYDLTITSVDLARRAVELSGRLAAMNEAFGTRLRLCQTDQGIFRGRGGELFPPADLESIVIGVFGLDNRPQAASHVRRKEHAEATAAARARSYAPTDVARAYGFGAGGGAGQTLAIIELGGGYRTSDLREYFAGLGISPPAVTAVSIGGARNDPTGDPNSADGEVLLDIEVAGAVAPEARLAVYFAPNTDKGFLDAIATAIHDPIRAPSVVSISWGAPEPNWTRQALRAYDEVFQDAAALGVTVCCASGDGGSGDGVGDGRAHVDFPASSPHVLACGGTTLEAAHDRVTREVAWNDGAGGGATGGGISDVFARPAYQQSAGLPGSANGSRFDGRGVPDVAGNADPETGYRIRVDGFETVLGGTSAVAPLWAALVALANARLATRLGHVNPQLYAAAAAGRGSGGHGFRDITSGDNGAYPARPGWDACTGLGSPDGATIFTPLRSRDSP
jgi:kumamolisin